jgi:small subunit ribosomal protein S3
MRIALREVMASGALGAEIRVAGKVVGKGAKAKALTVRSGYLKKSGELMKLVDVGHYTAYLKAGAIGVTVRIVPPGTVFSDQVSAMEIPETLPPTALEAGEGASAAGLSEEAKAENAAVEKALGEVEEAKEQAKEAAEAKKTKEEKKAPAVKRKKKEEAAGETQTSGEPTA